MPLVLGLLDQSWDRVNARLAGLTDDEARWEPVEGCWSVRFVDGGWAVDDSSGDPDRAPVTTIAWRMWHLAVDCFDSYSGRLFDATGSGLSGSAWVIDADDARARLTWAWSVFRGGVAAAGEDGLWGPLGPSWGPYGPEPLVALALHAHDELAHHGAEIALLRDLYPSR